MRVLALLGVAILGVSIYYAPAYRSARPAGRLGRSMADPDPRERIRRGEAERALGMMMSGYLDSDPDDPEVARGKFLTMVKLWAVAYAQPELRVMASREIDAFIARHKELDPGGSLIDEAVTAWIELRLTLPERMGYVVVAPAIFMAARNDRASIDRVLGFMKRGPFYGHLFPYVRRFHLRWDFVEQAIRQSLNTSDERARIEAGATLLDYHSLFGVGKELLETERKELLQSLTQGLRKIRIDYKAADRMDRHAEAILFGLALLGDEGAAVLERTPEIAVADHVAIYQIARLMAGIDPLDSIEIGTSGWRSLPNLMKEYYFRAGIHRYAQLRRQGVKGPRLEVAREVGEAATVSSHTVAQIYAVTTLSALFPEHARELMPRYLISKAAPAIFVAGMQPVKDTLAWLPEDERPAGVDAPSVLLPALLGALDYSALAAASLRRMDGPLPLMPPAR